MYGCSIVIPHVNTLYFLKFCVEQIRKYRHPEVGQEIIICDQSSEPVFDEIRSLYGQDPQIQLVRLPKSSHGYAIDMGVKNAKHGFFCTLDSDAFPIHRNWLYLPLRLMDKYGFSSVGHDSGMAMSYRQKGEFIHLGNDFHITRTDLAIQLSETVGFMRPEEWERFGFIPKDNSWGNDWADSGVVAQWYSDQKKLGDKLSLKLTSYVGHVKSGGIFGLVYEDLVFHLGYGSAEVYLQNLNEMLGSDFWMQRENMRIAGVSEPLIRSLIENSFKVQEQRTINGQPINPAIESEIEVIKSS